MTALITQYIHKQSSNWGTFTWTILMLLFHLHIFIFAGTFYYFLLILFYLIQLLIYLSKVIFSHKYAIKLARFMYLHQIIFVFSPFLCWWIILNAHSQIWDSFWQLTFLWKWWKMLFILRQKWFSFSRYLSFCLDFLVVYCPISQEVKANRQWNLVS